MGAVLDRLAELMRAASHFADELLAMGGQHHPGENADDDQRHASDGDNEFVADLGSHGGILPVGGIARVRDGASRSV
jgi:general stress protein YciG